MNYAEEELKLIEKQCEDEDELEMQKRINANIIELFNVFMEQGHSGFSGSYCLNKFERVARYLPVTPLTGEDDEWEDISYCSGEPKYQNKRCSRVFKNKDGEAYDSSYYYMRDEDGYTYTCGCSRKKITFPYMPQAPELLGTWKITGLEHGKCSICGHEGCTSDIWDGVKDEMHCPACGTELRIEKEEENN